MNKHNPARATLRDLFEYVISIPNVDEEAKEFAKNCIAALDARNAKRKSVPTKTQKENAELLPNIIEYVRTTDGVVASAVAEKFEISTQKASALLRQAVANGSLTVSDKKIAKKGIVKHYQAV